MQHDETWRMAIDAQHGVLTSAQLGKFGYSPKAIEFRVKSGQWLRVLHGVISITNGPLSRMMMLEAALLYGGRGSVLSHSTAAEEWGMRRQYDEGPIHITVRHGCSAVDQRPMLRTVSCRPTSSSNLVIHPGVVVHRSRAMAHIGVAFDQPRTSKADTAIDVAVAQPTPRLAMIAFVEAIASGAVSVDTMRRKLDVRRPRRYRRPLRDALLMLSDGVQSVLEHRYLLDVEQAHGLPSGRRQVLHRVDGRTLFEDVDYSDAGVPLIVRLDGQKFHSARHVRFRDRRRDNAAELADRPRLMYGWDEVVTDPCGVASEVVAVLVREGWRGEWVECGRCPRV